MNNSPRFCLGEEFNVFNPLGFEAKNHFEHKTSKIKSHSTRDSKRCLNDKCLIDGGETASTFRFSAENFETDLSLAAEFI